MLFNSIEYFILIIFVFYTYWNIFKKNIQYQNIFLLIISYIFYSFWNWKFLFLLLFSTLLDFICGRKIYKADKIISRKFWLNFSIIINIGFLGVFKYYNFFIESFCNLLKIININFEIKTLNILLPVGISFYTFHGISYIFDIYNNKIKPEKSIVNYSLFVSFFPLLVAGPIERATHLLPQIKKPRIFCTNKIIDGLKQILFGVFKKIVIADNCAFYVNNIFNDYENLNGSTLFIGAILFSFQIYGDFSGYSDIALGSARLLGFELLQNFNYPYFSKNIKEFWSRWHLSLTHWFRDYVYIPLGGNRKNKILNIFIVFFLSGLWHGANYTFIFWGLTNCFFYIIYDTFFQNKIKLFNNFKIVPILLNFIFITFIWIIFRSENLEQLKTIIDKIFSSSFFELPVLIKKKRLFNLIILIIVLITIEWQGKESKHALEQYNYIYNSKSKTIIYYFILILIFCFSAISQDFIYFQF